MRIQNHGRHRAAWAVCHFRLAVGRNRKVEGKPEADFISCVCWGKTAEFAVKYLHRGGMITAEGRLQNADYTDNNGVKHYAMEVNVDQLNFCGDGKPSGNAQQAAQGRCRQLSAKLPTAAAERLQRTAGRIL